MQQAPTTSAPAVTLAPRPSKADHSRSMPASPSGVLRRVILAAALGLGLVVGAWSQPNLAGAADDSPAAGATTPPAAAASGGAATDSESKPSTGSKAAPGAEGEVSISPHGIVISGTAGTTDDGKRIDVQHGRVKVEGFGDDHQYDSFEQFMKEAPGTAVFVFLIVLVVFFTPLLFIALLIWYKIRKTRMHNETLLKLAERGAVPPTVAMEALSAGATPTSTLEAFGKSPAGPGAGPAASTAPLYEQVRMIRRRTAWSDLRKGVILIAIGVGLSAYSMFDDGTPNGAGLICLFLGIGYCVLWFFQDRPVTGQNQSPPSPPGGA